MTAQSEGSFSKLNYLLRPSKQVERKLIIEALHLLGIQGYSIPDYRYVGLGSIYFADFLMFHKYLYINDMLCVEHKEIEQRMRFNRPFEFIELYMGPVSEVLPTLDRSRPHLIWLDYDYTLGVKVLSDCNSALTVMAPGSLLIVTVTAQLSEVERASSAAERHERSLKHAAQFNEWFGHILSEPVEPRHLTRKRLPQLFADVFRLQFADTTRARADADLDFMQIFNYKYADGASMLTFGGIIETPERIAHLESGGYLRESFACRGREPMLISVPQLTVREKQWLDQNLRSVEAGLECKEFEIDKESLENYCKFYRHYPTYYETLV